MYLLCHSFEWYAMEYPASYLYLLSIHESYRNAVDREIRLVAKSNATYARRKMGRLGVLPSCV